MLRKGIIVLLALAIPVGALVATTAEAVSSEGSGFSVAHPKFRHFCDHRGGKRVLGYPISRVFKLMGTEVQFFQRGVVQHRSDWSVGLLDILEEGLLPYTHVGGLTLPSPDPTLLKAAPSPADPSFGEKAIAFVQANAPEEWEGVRTNFYSTFAGTVTYRDAFPKADADPALVPLINLEMWGFPVSKPARDPRNHDFVYLRFQRGILHFDKGSGETKWLPVGEYLKALITGRNLPTDLEQEARGSRLYRQYDNSHPNGLANPSVLSGTDLFAAFEEDGVVVPTPVPATPTPAATTASLTKPEQIEILGSEWFVDQANYALAMLPGNTIDFIYKIVEVPDYSRFDIPNRTLYVTERDAFVPTWRENRDAQILWYGGWIAHVLVHAEQYWNGRPTTGLQAEQEARLRQKDFLLNHDCDCIEGAFVRRLTEAINRANLEFGEWAGP